MCSNCALNNVEYLYAKNGDLRGELCENCGFVDVNNSQNIPSFSGQQISKGKRRNIF